MPTPGDVFDTPVFQHAMRVEKAKTPQKPGVSFF
jgi:hypothetical protein